MFHIISNMIEQMHSFYAYHIIFLKILFIHENTQEREREREAETQAEGEAGSMQGARRGTRSQVSRITPWAEGGAKLLSHPAGLLSNFQIALL